MLCSAQSSFTALALVLAHALLLQDGIIALVNVGFPDYNTTKQKHHFDLMDKVKHIPLFEIILLISSHGRELLM